MRPPTKKGYRPTDIPEDSDFAQDISRAIVWCVVWAFLWFYPSALPAFHHPSSLAYFHSPSIISFLGIFRSAYGFSLRPPLFPPLALSYYRPWVKRSIERKDWIPRNGKERRVGVAIAPLHRMQIQLPIPLFPYRVFISVLSIPMAGAAEEK